MNDGFYIAASGMRAVQRLLDNSAHNTVNANTPGYQNHELLMESFGALLSDARERSGLIGTREIIKFEPGHLRASDSPYDIGLTGEGFLTVADGRGRSYYTRNGQLTLNAAGELVTQVGYRVPGEGGEPIVIDPRAGGVTIERDGTVLQQGAEVGRLQLVELDAADRAQLKPAGETLFEAPAGVEPRPATATEVRQGYLEMPQDGGMMGVVKMLLANKNYEAMQRAIRTLDRVQERVIGSVQ